MKTPYLDEMINELEGYIGSSDNYLSKKGNEKLNELKAIKNQILTTNYSIRIINLVSRKSNERRRYGHIEV